MDDRETVKTWVVRNLDLLADYRTDAVENSLTNMVAAVRAPLEQRIATLEAALEKAADTFRDIGRMSKALGRTAVWETCNIAEEGTRAALAAPKKEEA